MLYSDWVNIVGNDLPEQILNPNTETPFVNGSRYNFGIDRAIEYAELRMYRDADLDLLSERATITVVANQGLRKLNIPTGMVLVEDVNIITPVGATPNTAGSSRNQIVPVSEPFMNRVWPSQDFQGQPKHYNRKDDVSILLGPVPDGAYSVEFYGTVRPQPLSSSNTSTVLTLNFPDIFLAATMIWWSMYQKNLGAVQSVGPLEGVTWEEQYQNLKKGAVEEEARKRFQSAGWSAEAPTTIATPPRQ